MQTSSHMKMEILVIVSWVVSFWGVALAFPCDCPPTELLSFSKWSEDSTWDGTTNSPAQLPGQADDVVISGNVILDVEDLEVRTIQVSGHLVFSREVDVHLKTHYIHVLDGGIVEIGREGCYHPTKAIVTLLGEPSSSINIPHLGDKFVGVASGGTLELHGLPKLSWTKLAEPLNKIPDEAYTAFYSLKGSDISNGLYAAVLDFNDGSITNTQNWFFSKTNQNSVDSRVAEIQTFIDGVTNGSVIAFAVGKTVIGSSGETSLSGLADVLEKLGHDKITNDSPIRSIKENEPYSFVTVKGNHQSTKENHVNVNAASSGLEAKVTIYFGVDDAYEIDVVSFTNPNKANDAIIYFDVKDTDYGTHTLTVLDNVDTWTAGDELFITSTDYDWRQLEFGKVVKASGKTVTFKMYPEYKHYGGIYKTIDMRAEIGVLTRNIVIEGAKSVEEPLYGGHIKALVGYKNFHLSNIEVRYMGQHKILGRYPVHWHMCVDVDSPTYDKPTYAISNSVHHSLSRCFTVHGTHGVRLENNTCVISVGHGYFLEDGGEKRTVLKGNLGVGQKVGTLIKSDSSPTTFWLTNPNVLLENNVAAGSDHTGIWYVFTDVPLGLSKDMGFIQPEESRHTAISGFLNNVAHSNAKTGMMFDERMEPDGTVVNYNFYEPWNDPLDPDSGPKKVVFNKITAYKNVENAWIRGGWLEVINSGFSDGAVGITLTNNPNNDQIQYMFNSVVIGDSDNKGEPFQTFSRSVPDPEQSGMPHKGVVLYKGPEAYDSIYFDGFADTSLYKSGAIGFRYENRGHNSPINRFKNMQFAFNDPVDGNRVYDPRPNEPFYSTVDGDRLAMFYDMDGSITSLTGVYTVKDDVFIKTDRCASVSNWNMAVCDEPIGQVDVIWNGNNDDKVYLMRNDNLETQEGDNMANAPFNVILNDPEYRYTVYFDGKVPRDFSIQGLMVQNSAPAYISVCMPKDLSTLTVKHRIGSGRTLTSGSSVDDVDNEALGKKYYFNSTSGILYMKMAHEANITLSSTVTQGDQYDCPGGQCSTLLIEYTGGTNTDTDCTSHVIKTSPSQDGSITLPASFPASGGSQPPEGYGPGPTR